MKWSRKNRRRTPTAERIAERRKAWRMAALWTLRGALTLVVTGALFTGAARAQKWAVTSPRLALAEVRVLGTHRVDANEIRALAGLTPGTNLFKVDLASACRGAERHPWIASIHAARRFPNAVELTVREYAPVALVNLGGLYFVDAAGTLVKRAQPGDTIDVPIISGSGLTRARWEENPKDAAAILGEALSAIATYTASGLEKDAALAEVRVEEERALTLVIADDGAEVRVGTRDDLRTKLDRLARLRTELKRRGAHAITIDLDNRTRPSWVAVRFAATDRLER